MAVTVRPTYAPPSQADQAQYQQGASPVASNIANNSADQALYQQDVSTVESDIANNNFNGAWSTGMASSGLFNAGKYSTDSAAMNQQTTDPLLSALENNVSQLDPSKTWNSAETNQFYNAFNANADYAGKNIIGQGGGVESLGANPSGLWGKQGDITSGHDAQVNEQVGGAPDVARFAGSRPDQSFLSKYGGDIVSVVGDVAGSFVGDPMAGNQIMAVYDATQGNWAGALGNAASSFVPGAGSALAGATGLSTGVATGLVGAGVGAAGAGLAGSNPLLGAISGGVSGALSGSGFGQNVSNSVGGGLLGNVAGSLATNAVKMGAGLVGNSLVGNSGSGAAAGTGNGMSANLFSGNTLLGLGGLGFGVAGNNQQSNMITNAYTAAGNAGNTMPWNVSGSGGMGANFTNGNASINYGNMAGAANNYGTFANNQSRMANLFGLGGVPSNVTSSFNQYNNALNQSSAYNTTGQGAAAGQMFAGLAQENNPLVGQAQGMSANMMNSQNANYNSAYNTALTAGQQALNPQIQQQSNALLNSNFERGMSGTSGGALQTQALQNSFNTAELQNQGNAVNQANTAMMNTGNLAGLYSSIATGQQNTGLNMFNTGAGQMNNFNQMGANFGNAGFGASENYNMYSPQLAGAYNQNANSAVQGNAGINTTALQNANFGLALGTNQGNQMNTAARTMGSIAENQNYTNQAMGYGTALNGSASNGLGSLFGSVGSGLGSLFGGGSGSNSGISYVPSNVDTSNMDWNLGNDLSDYS